MPASTPKTLPIAATIPVAAAASLPPVPVAVQSSATLFVDTFDRDVGQWRLERPGLLDITRATGEWSTGGAALRMSTPTGAAAGPRIVRTMALPSASELRFVGRFAMLDDRVATLSFNVSYRDEKGYLRRAEITYDVGRSEWSWLGPDGRSTVALRRDLVAWPNARWHTIDLTIDVATNRYVVGYVDEIGVSFNGAALSTESTKPVTGPRSLAFGIETGAHRSDGNGWAPSVLLVDELRSEFRPNLEAGQYYVEQHDPWPYATIFDDRFGPDFATSTGSWTMNGNGRNDVGTLDIASAPGSEDGGVLRLTKPAAVGGDSHAEWHRYEAIAPGRRQLRFKGRFQLPDERVGYFAIYTSWRDNDGNWRVGVLSYGMDAQTWFATTSRYSGSGADGLLPLIAQRFAGEPTAWHEWDVTVDLISGTWVAASIDGAAMPINGVPLFSALDPGPGTNMLNFAFEVGNYRTADQTFAPAQVFIDRASAEWVG